MRRLFHYEARGLRPLGRAAFHRRLLRHGGVAAAMVGVSLGLGMAGYHVFERLPWLDAFLNAAMLLGGMGPVDVPRTSAGKFFAGCYALYAGLVFLVVAATLLAPVLHRLLHRFHWEGADEPGGTP